MQVCARELLPIGIGVRRTIYVEPCQHNHRSCSILEFKLRKSKRSPPDIEKEGLSVIRTGELIRIIRAQRNGNRGRTTYKVLGHGHELIGFGLGQHS